MTRAALFAVLGLLIPATAQATECRKETFRSDRYTICEVDMTTQSLELFLYNPDGAPFGYFDRVNDVLSADGKTLGFAMNAGMYHEDRAPVGLYIEDGVQVQDVVTAAGPGNFGLLPNGVLCLRDGRADVFETLRFVAQAPDCTFATQSGPILVIDGALHPRFLKDGTSRFIRNGVGTSADGTRAVFVISDNPVTFFEFGNLFRDHLTLPNALFLDGNVSRLRAPTLNRDDLGFSPLGPIIGVVETPAN